MTSSVQRGVLTVLLILLAVSLVTGQSPTPTPTLPNRPKALVFEFADPWTKRIGAARVLAAAGFDVAPLPLDRSPADLTADVIVLGSFVSESPEYRAYAKRYAADLYHYVDRGHVLVQLTQADQTEASPPFLPTTQGARRSDRDFASARILVPDHPLVRGLDAAEFTFGGELFEKRTIWETFAHQSGFQVVVAGDRHARFPALLEGAYGQGRFVLAALACDKVHDPERDVDTATAELRAFNDVFWRNLATHAVAVRDRKAPALDVTPPPIIEQPFVEGSWTIAVLPDTQVYSLRHPGLFTLQTDWIVANRDAFDIRYVLHLGDIVNNNTDLEWRRAAAALSRLDGKVPLALVPGNHDYGPSGDASTRDTRMNDHLSFAAAKAMPTFGGAMEDGRLDNTFHRFRAGDRDWIVVALEWGPRDATIEWANDVLRRHPDHKAILITHAYMNNDDRRYDHTSTEHPQLYNPHKYRTPGGVNDGEQLWQKLVRKHDFVLVLNGHVLGDGTGYLASRNDRGRVVHQLLQNFQMRTLGGEGYLRLFEFRPDGRTLVVKTYSPLHDAYLLEPDQQHVLEIDLGER